MMNDSTTQSPIYRAVGLLLAVFLVTLIFINVKEYRYIGDAPRTPHTITISGSGKITASPNIAVTNIGLVTEKTDVATAQKENSEKMNSLISSMKSLGIADADIKTSQYQVYPKYSYDSRAGTSNITGYTVSQSVEIKIRDLTKISDVLGRAGQTGANQVSGIQFTIDEPKNLRAEAREQAVKDAKEKAEKLADQLDVRLGKVASFTESYGGGAPVPMMAYATKDSGLGMGGGSPEVATGSLEIESEISVTYEIK